MKSSPEWLAAESVLQLMFGKNGPPRFKLHLSLQAGKVEHYEVELLNCCSVAPPSAPIEVHFDRLLKALAACDKGLPPVRYGGVTCVMVDGELKRFHYSHVCKDKK